MDNPPITNERDALAIRIGHVCGDGVRESIRHGGEHAGQRIHLSALDPNLSRPPRRDRAAVAGSNLILAFSQRLHDAVDAIARQADNDLDAPIVKRVDEHICRGIRHETPPLYGRIRPSCAAADAIGRRRRPHVRGPHQRGVTC
jgi:hypothetical protein